VRNQQKDSSLKLGQGNSDEFSYFLFGNTWLIIGCVVSQLHYWKYKIYCLFTVYNRLPNSAGKFSQKGGFYYYFFLRLFSQLSLKTLDREESERAMHIKPIYDAISVSGVHTKPENSSVTVFPPEFQTIFFALKVKRKQILKF
jgi:hypothetical protein